MENFLYWNHAGVFMHIPINLRESFLDLQNPVLVNQSLKAIEWCVQSVIGENSND